jgi:hypothetical protein
MAYEYNRFLPERPKVNSEGETLSYRTHIDDPHSRYRLYDPDNMTAQVILYHWCRNDFVNFVSIAELRDILFTNFPSVSKSNMGRTILQTTIYNPRRLKGVTKDNDKATACYLWRFKEELQYGLEWMLSMWIWRLENQWKDIHTNTNEQHAEMTLDIFDDLAALNVRDMESLYAGEVMNEHAFERVENIDWMALWAKYNMTKEGRAQEQVPKTRGNIRSFNSGPAKQVLKD